MHCLCRVIISFCMTLCLNCYSVRPLCGFQWLEPEFSVETMLIFCTVTVTKLEELFVLYCRICLDG